ncbi:hypothetical protein AAFF_G00229230 [Aldrovandia affinis]|uniref:HAT C-terminal dimerisation domain-containing protein n=1 Tax=Aldrovandia affinis TaxID=143900 RepID=A0AAD7SWN4_9TELE|nr:hypothetical protein AAFF_G00229230 [Aldrovandia affinis]
MKTMTLKSMILSDDDSPAVRDVKTAIRNDLEQRYVNPGLQDYRQKSAALDPRFKSLLHLDAWRVYDTLTTEIVSIEQQEPGTKSVAKIAEEEVISFRAVDSIPSDADPLEWWKTHGHIYPHISERGGVFHRR